MMLSTMKMFAYMIKSNDISMDVARTWCFNQYGEDEYPLWIEDITMDSSKDELLSLLREYENADGCIDFEYEVAAFCQWYKDGGFSLYALIQNLLIAVDKTKFDSETLELLEKSEAMFQSDKDVKQSVLEMMNDFIETQCTYYQKRMNDFKKEMKLETLK